MKTTYMGKQYELLDIDDAVDEFDRQEAKGSHKAIMEVPGGYVVVDTIPSEKEQTLKVLRAQGMTDEEADVFLEGVKKGLQALREGKVRPWSEIKKELNL